MADRAAPTPPPRPLPFIDLEAQRERLGPRLELAIARVLAHGRYIMGPEIAELEAELAAFAGVRHAIGCGSGTDALALALMAKGVRSGDAILVPSFTFVASVEVVAWFGATPIYLDVLPGTFNLDPETIGSGVGTARELGLRPVGLIAVDLFGQPADYERIEPACAEHGLWLLADAAQSFGAELHGRRTGAIGEIAATSFFPAKPLGCYGDGGAVFTDDDDLAAAMRSLRVHGEGTDKYDNVRIGMNARLDTLQAAILLEKLRIFPDEITLRQNVAARYADGLQGLVRTPMVIAGAQSTWAQYTILIGDHDREALVHALKTEGIPTATYYAKAVHQQIAYRHYPRAGAGLPATERLTGQVLSLPMHPYLDMPDQDRIIHAIRRELDRQASRNRP